MITGNSKSVKCRYCGTKWYAEEGFKYCDSYCKNAYISECIKYYDKNHPEPVCPKLRQGG